MTNFEATCTSTLPSPSSARKKASLSFQHPCALIMRFLVFLGLFSGSPVVNSFHSHPSPFLQKNLTNDLVKKLLARSAHAPWNAFRTFGLPPCLTLCMSSPDSVVDVEEVVLPSDPRYSTHGPIGGTGFVIQREGDVRPEELTNENILRIVELNSTDLEVNTLVWKGLGYRFSPEQQKWENSQVFPKWREKFPDPPDLIGMQRIYTKEIDQPSLKSNQRLVQSVPVENKQSLRKHLRPLGFKGYKLADLTPNKTRRAQCANWLLFYRDELYGYTVEELKAKRERKQAQRLKDEEEERKRLEKEGKEKKDEWKPPVTEVF